MLFDGGLFIETKISVYFYMIPRDSFGLRDKNDSKFFELLISQVHMIDLSFIFLIK